MSPASEAEAIRQSGTSVIPSACTDSVWHGKTNATGQSTIAGSAGSTTSRNGRVTGTRGAETLSGTSPAAAPSVTDSRTTCAPAGTAEGATRASVAAGSSPVAGTPTAPIAVTSEPETAPNSATTLVPLPRSPVVVTTSGSPPAAKPPGSANQPVVSRAGPSPAASAC